MKKKWLLHIGFWLAYWLIFTFANTNYDGNWQKFAICEAVQMPARILATYLSFWCLDRFKPSWMAFAGVIGAVLLGGLMSRLTKMLYIVPEWSPGKPFVFWSARYILDSFDTALSIGALLTARLYFRQKESQRREAILRAEKSDAELRALKNQLNPHFLFNTINNLYALARAKSNKTAPVALQLAQLLRYLLYDSAAKTVRIEQEINHLNQFIELEKIRFDEDLLTVKMDVSIDDLHQLVTPLLLLPLVENAFKHGASERYDEAWVHINISLKNRVLNMKVENSRSEMPVNGDKGIGLQNIRRQLELLYPNTAQLTTSETATTYTAHLTIAYPS